MAEATKLAQDLEDAAQSAIAWCQDVLTRPVNPDAPAMLRAQSSAALTALNTQIRADALRLRAAREDKALQNLLKLIADKEATVPQTEPLFLKESCAQSAGLLDDRSSGSAL